MEVRSACPFCRAVFRRAMPRCPIDGSELRPLPGDPLLGAELAGLYRVYAVLADGSTARVYRAVRREDQAECAVKVLLGDYASLERHRARFAREIEVALDLVHPNLIGAIDAGATEGGVPFLIMPLVRGPLLATVIQRDAPLGRERAARIARDLAGGLAHLHRVGYVHRDVRPENVILEQQQEDENARLFDFGIAARLPGNAPGEPRLTRPNKLLGKPQYAAPEVHLEARVDGRADLFSLGVLLYQMLSGTLPFDGAPLAVASSNSYADPPAIAERVPGLHPDPALEELAHDLMRADPGRRLGAEAVVQLLSHA
ncbi:MAG TPA: serine/threonine-protein kinase [Kofleriaceae bacterium]|nr:serine/threonine-protein kinase [Kofleriaceae bacterium]